MTTSQHEAPSLPEGNPSGRGSKIAEAAATTPSKAGRTRRNEKAARRQPPRKAKRANLPKSTRKSSKTGKVLALLQRPNGASLPELIRATGWQPH